MVMYAVLGYLIGFSIVVYWRFHKIEDYPEDIINKLDREYKNNNGVIIPNEWKISPENAEIMLYNAVQEVMRGYDKK